MWTEDTLNDLLAEPSSALTADISRINGDIMVLGAGGKMGPSLCMLAKNAVDRAGVKARVIAVSRFSDEAAKAQLAQRGIEIIPCDLQDTATLSSLPEAPNIIYMVGRKFGTHGAEALTWGANAVLPSLVGERFRASRIVVLSSGNVYPFVPAHSGGADEATMLSPLGEYAMSCLARERIFEYASARYGAKMLFVRLNYAVDLRYGVLFDIARLVSRGEPVPLATGSFNCVWQGFANEAVLRSLLRADNPPAVLNVTGPEIIGIRYAAERFGELLGANVRFEGEEGGCALLSNSSKMVSWFGYPPVGAHTLIQWQAGWMLDGGRSLGKPTHFEETGGKF